MKNTHHPEEDRIIIILIGIFNNNILVFIDCFLVLKLTYKATKTKQLLVSALLILAPNCIKVMCSRSFFLCLRCSWWPCSRTASAGGRTAHERASPTATQAPSPALSRSTTSPTWSTGSRSGVRSKSTRTFSKPVRHS